ncbi:MAG TPA: hypothetical protein VGB49_04595 [Caulobacteraceae bacterium]|jgi:hypothetical protein
MRKFLVWSALALVIGAALAAGAYWAYWNYYARFQPVVVTRNQAEVQGLLDAASWVSPGGGGQPLYLIGWRDCAACLAYERTEFPKLRAAGVEPRVIVVARPDREGMAQSSAAERATVAELWLTRDWALYQRWTATPARNWSAAGIPAADGDMARSAVVTAGREFMGRVEMLLRGAGVGRGYPLILWRDREGVLKACACSDARSFAFIRDDLAAPEAVGGDASPAGPDQSLPLPPVSPAPAPAPATPPPAAPKAAPAAPRTPLPPPEPSQDEDTVFY